jgi:hypothetical protein
VVIALGVTEQVRMKTKVSAGVVVAMAHKKVVNVVHFAHASALVVLGMMLDVIVAINKESI